MLKYGCLLYLRNILYKRNIFLLSHMRSRSSLISHILGSNPQVSGYYEHHRSYRNYVDLLKVRCALHRELRKRKTVYFCDKLLHNSLFVSGSVLRSQSSKVIIMIREPSETIKSIMRMAAMTGVEWYGEAHLATEYYIKRLEALVRCSHNARNNYFFFDSSRLVSDTDNVLGELTQWLGLENRLQGHYEKFRNTGRPGYGDPSDNIGAGEIIDTRTSDDIIIGNEILASAKRSYGVAKEQLTAYGIRP